VLLSDNFQFLLSEWFKTLKRGGGGLDFHCVLSEGQPCGTTFIVVGWQQVRQQSLGTLNFLEYFSNWKSKGKTRRAFLLRCWYWVRRQKIRVIGHYFQQATHRYDKKLMMQRKWWKCLILNHRLQQAFSGWYGVLQSTPASKNWIRVPCKIL